jgi:predicted N-acetyltransferase YhbS
MGVDPARRSRGVGRELALAALHDMRSHGYAYAVIGWVGPSDFYRKAVGAVPIEGSDACTGMYRDLLRHDP